MPNSTENPSARTNVVKAEARNLSFHYGAFQALKGINMPIYEKQVTALIGPSGCGKSTYLRCFNRMHDLYPNNRYEGEIRLFPDNTNLLNRNVDPIEVRMRISMVFQKPNPFPKSIYENVAYGLRVRGVNRVATVDEKVEQALRGAALWDEVKDRLQELAFNLSGGQQQRLCIARALATEPEILLFDEPTSALDPEMTAEVLDMIAELRAEGRDLVLVTHQMGFARRVADRIAFVGDGGIAAHGTVAEMLDAPSAPQVRRFLDRVLSY